MKIFCSQTIKQQGLFCNTEKQENPKTTNVQDFLKTDHI